MAAYAQASVTGVVKDTSGAVLPGVTVEVSSPALIEKTRSTVTDGSGLYQIISLPPGAYTVSFTLTGFTTVKREGVELSGSFIASINADLKVGGVTETIDITHLVEESLRINTGGFERHAIVLTREFERVPPITVDKHKVLQILVNLLRNAKDACEVAGNALKRVTIRVARCAHGIQVAVTDTGVGIPPENMTRIFNHGFTTKKNGHGFGLHSGALAAKELGGALRVQSLGTGQGATFVLELPIQPPE